MEIVKIDAKVRSEAGKGPANRLRREGQIPAVAYGKALAATPISISPKALLGVLKSEHGKNTVVALGIEGGKSVTAMVRDYAYHPITRELLHADFIEIKLDAPVDVEVPFITTGKPAGVVLGGVLRIVYRMLPISCLPEKIPTSIGHDVTSLELGESVKASQVVLPEGVTIRLPPDQTVTAVVAPEKEKEEAPAPGTAAAGALAAAAQAAGTAPAAGAAAAPAAGGKDAKAAPAGKDKKK